MKPQYQRVVDDVEAIRYDWQELMGLGWMDIQHRYVESFDDSSPTVVADTEAVWEYRYATVRFFLPGMVRLDRSELEDTLIHEYTHILLAPIESKIPVRHTELKEFTVEGLTKAFRRIRDES